MLRAIGGSVVILVLIAGTARSEPHTAKTPTMLVARKKAQAAKAEDDALLAMTNDPILGKADRISGEEAHGLVAFTFDDGPNPGTTPSVIAALQKYNIPATFFIVTRRIVGKQGTESRAILKRELESGFLVGSHSVTHANLRGASPPKLAAEIDQSVRMLSKETERPIAMFRAPFGAIDAHGRGWLKRRGLTETFWSIDTRDWQAKSAERLRKKIFNMIVKQNGGVVLMHDVKEITAKITSDVLDDLEGENCKRLAEGRAPIWPVSIHYFLRDKRKLRGIPDDVKKQTDAYQLALPLRCAARPPVVPDSFKIFFLE